MYSWEDGVKDALGCVLRGIWIGMVGGDGGRGVVDVDDCGW